uniref:Uncharacterized protein n=1 Tax=Arundo donax TaxID=35708 RepID=A0A0A9B0M2_ARUDO
MEQWTMVTDVFLLHNFESSTHIIFMWAI